mgnify:CR=1 FL=1
MYIESIRLNNFRNYELLEMNFDQGTNILYGDNARERPISWRRFIWQVPANPTREARTGR